MGAEILYDVITKYCNERYLSSECHGCNHVLGCPGSVCGDCKQCLEEIHFPDRRPNGRKDYNCERLLDFYVCNYTSKYASEILYLIRECEVMKEIDNYKILSIGCGACPDLMAFEKYCTETSNLKRIQYTGIDINKRWSDIHEKIKRYRSKAITKTEIDYSNAVTESIKTNNVNVVVLQYVISYLYNSGGAAQINTLFNKIRDSIVTYRKEEPIVILINDVNSINLGRDLFLSLLDSLKAENHHGYYNQFYFDYNIKNEAQRYGWKHVSNNILFQLPEGFRETYKSWEVCSSAQLMIEVEI